MPNRLTISRAPQANEEMQTTQTTLVVPLTILIGAALLYIIAMLAF